MTSSAIAEDPSLTPIATMVVWITWLTVGVGGLLMPYPRPMAPPRPLAPVIAHIINVQVTEQSRPPPDLRRPAPQTPEISEPPPPPGEMAVPAEPPMAEIAAPTPAVAFAVPTTRPARIVAANQVTTARPAETVPVASKAPLIAHITFGEGEGIQPAPDYPLEAQLDGEQGTVVVQFEVAQDGHVASAEIESACPWPLLNQSALRAVRETWQFAPRSTRSYDVAIQYKAPDQ
jgi:TonB family protein